MVSSNDELILLTLEPGANIFVFALGAVEIEVIGRPCQGFNDGESRGA
jgi:hypothetical protein